MNQLTALKNNSAVHTHGRDILLQQTHDLVCSRMMIDRDVTYSHSSVILKEFDQQAAVAESSLFVSVKSLYAHA
jgi:hypothetical protein